MRPIRKKAQEKKLRRVVEGEAACPIQRSTARREEELDGRAKKESRGALWKKRPKRGTIIRVGVDGRRNSSVILNLQVQRKGVSYRRQLGARSDLLLEVERIKLVWMQRKDRGEGGVAQRGKSTAERHMVSVRGHLG